MKLEIKNLSKKFKNEIVFQGANMEFNEGKIYGLIGKNGSGKSVLLKMICGLYIPTEGTVLFDDIDYIAEHGFPNDTRASIEEPGFIGDMSGFQNLKMLASIQGKISDEQILNTLKMVNLYDERNKVVHKYSRGMKQKLAIAQVLMENPKIMIFDEPFNGLEESTTSKIRELLKSIKKDKIIIIATHYKEDIELLADEIYKIENRVVCKI